MNKHAYKTRLKGVRAAIARAGADCLIAAKPANVTYLTGFSGQDSWAIVLPRAVALVTDSRYTEQAAAQCRFCKIVERTAAMSNTIAELLRKQRGIKTAAVEKSISLANFQSLRKTCPAGSRPPKVSSNRPAGKKTASRLRPFAPPQKSPHGLSSVSFDR